MLLVRQNERGSLRGLCDCPDGFDPRLLSFGGEEAGKLVFPDACHANSHENPLIESCSYRGECLDDAQEYGTWDCSGEGCRTSLLRLPDPQ